MREFHFQVTSHPLVSCSRISCNLLRISVIMNAKEDNPDLRPAGGSKHPRARRYKGLIESMRERSRPVTGSVRAGLVFPVARIHSKLRKSSQTRVGATAAVYFASVLEYLSAEVLHLGGFAAEKFGTTRINPYHLQISINNDDELNKVFQNIIADGGEIPYIHEDLIKNNPEAPSTSHAETCGDDTGGDDTCGGETRGAGTSGAGTSTAETSADKNCDAETSCAHTSDTEATTGETSVMKTRSSKSTGTQSLATKTSDTQTTVTEKYGAETLAAQTSTTSNATKVKKTTKAKKAKKPATDPPGKM